ncbi:NAD-dependent epimerase/dehydratase family protein [Actinoallomurus sp. CA-142502]|uniref:NAD-dependent epimerase/dehydratase family protein n=1 Tax=Actinoallomurus sp. CA-142502 TaxID=3239885 RepID=UPI003D940AC1
MSDELPTVFVTGAGGFVGSQLVSFLAARGWNVVASVRDPERFETRENVRYVALDLGKTFDVTMFKGVDYLVHTAYVKLDRAHKDAFDVNVGGTERLLAAAREQGVKKSIFMSSMSAHEDAVSIYGRQKLAIESMLDDSNDVILRCGLIVGSGGIVQQMAKFMRTKRIVPLVDGGTQPLQIISIHDLLQVIEQVLERDLHGRFVVANPEVYAYKELYKAMGRQLGVNPIFLPVPFFVLLTAMRTIAFLRLPLAVNEDNLWGLKKLRAVDNAADVKELGVKLDTLHEALTRLGTLDA